MSSWGIFETLSAVDGLCWVGLLTFVDELKSVIGVLPVIYCFSCDTPNLTVTVLAIVLPVELNAVKIKICLEVVFCENGEVNPMINNIF